MSNRCLYCYKEITHEYPGAHPDFHTKCSRAFFGTDVPPLLDFSLDDVLDLAERIVKTQKTVTGVQPKLSLNTQRRKNSENIERFTLIGLWGEYILKPQTALYPQLPEIEDLTMHLAENIGISTVPHSLIRLRSGELAYITKRIDRVKKQKLHIEDMCQLTERLTEYKYKGSHEQIAKVIRKYSRNPGLDVYLFYEVVLFNYLVGNNDGHLKNYSLLKNINGHYLLSPFYDLVATSLVVEGDDEELALTLNGKKKNLKRNDFEKAMKSSGMHERQIFNLISRALLDAKRGTGFIQNRSFISDEFQTRLIKSIDQRIEQMQA